jgi:beta-mannosidase
MSRKTLLLDGEWALRFCDAGKREAAGWPLTGVAGEAAHVALVPGDVHLDMVCAGVIQEPLFGQNAKSCEWMEEKDWWYSTAFRLAEEFIGDHVELHFGGVDTLADIWLNGQSMGRSCNALVPYTVDVTDAIGPGENLLVVRVDCGMRWARQQDLEP